MSIAVAMLIVPRGDTKEFYEFLAVAAYANGDSLIIDRRRDANRRVETYGAAREKRHGERRGTVPAILTQEDLTVVK